MEEDASPLVPAHPTLERLRRAAAGCQACPLYERGTQTVFGAGASNAAVMLVGEQPGDQEDRRGLPFVGPAGRLLDRALELAGIHRGLVYVTNVVKHFKWAPQEGRGKRRIHQKPNAREIAACRPWLDAEIVAVDPRVVVCLGATAAQALAGRDFKVTEQRGKIFDWEGRKLMATVHPSAVLRARDEETRHRELARLVVDLKKLVPLIQLSMSRNI